MGTKYAAIIYFDLAEVQIDLEASGAHVVPLSAAPSADVEQCISVNS